MANEDRAFRARLLSDVRIEQCFPEIGAGLYVLGGMFSHPSIVAAPDAWLRLDRRGLRKLGYDCSNANPDWERVRRKRNV